VRLRKKSRGGGGDSEEIALLSTRATLTTSLLLRSCYRISLLIPSKLVDGPEKATWERVILIYKVPIPGETAKRELEEKVEKR
jgi:hypothetical protein